MALNAEAEEFVPGRMWGLDSNPGYTEVCHFCLMMFKVLHMYRSIPYLDSRDMPMLGFTGQSHLRSTKHTLLALIENCKPQMALCFHLAWVCL